MATLSAQTPTDERPDPWLLGVSVGIPGYESDALPELFTLDVHATRVEPGRVGGDFAIGTMPRVLFEGALALGGRADLALPLALSEKVLLLPSGGAGMITAIGSDGGVLEPSLNLGVAGVVLDDTSTGFRAGISWHRFRNSFGAVWLFEFGIVRRRGGP